MPDSPAAKAGFKPGDVVVKSGNINVVDSADFERSLLGHKTGEVIDVVVRRRRQNGRPEARSCRRQRKAHRSPRDSQIVFRGAEPEEDDNEALAWRTLGMQLVPVTGDTSVFSGSQYHGGMRIVKVRNGSPAEMNGIRPGDILVGLHLWETVTPQNVSWVLENPEFPKFNPLKFYILRGRDTLYGHMQPGIQVGQK